MFAISPEQCLLCPHKRCNECKFKGPSEVDALRQPSPPRPEVSAKRSTKKSLKTLIGRSQATAEYRTTPRSGIESPTEGMKAESISPTPFESSREAPEQAHRARRPEVESESSMKKAFKSLIRRSQATPEHRNTPGFGAESHSEGIEARSISKLRFQDNSFIVDPEQADYIVPLQVTPEYKNTSGFVAENHSEGTKARSISPMPLESSTEAYEQAHRTRNVDSEESDEAVPAEVLPSLPFLGVRLLFRGIKVAAEFLELTEKPLHDGLKRIRWTCVCGCSLYDDFKEFAPGALDELQNLLNNGENTDVINLHEEADRTDNSTDAAHYAARSSQRRPKVAPVRQATGDTSIHNDPRSTKGLAKSSPQSSQSIQSRNDHINRIQAEGNNNNSPQGLRQRHPTRSEIGTSAMGYNAWVLPIFQYDRYGTRVNHLRVDQTTSDKDLFVNIKEKYHQETSKVRRFFVMRGVKKISCVKFVHAAVEPDIHKFDDWPGQKHSPPWIYKGCPAKKSHIPLVGHTYLMHLWQHPSHCDRQTYNSHRQTSIARLFRQLGFCRGGFGTSGMPDGDPDAPGNASRHDTELAGMNSSTSNGNRALDGRDSPGPRSSYVLLRIPKKLGEQLTASDEDPPEAWGLYFEEGFGVHHFLLIILMMYAMASLGFAIYWCERYGLVGPNSGSGAFAVASWMVSFITLIVTVWFKWAD
ncbi:MAG: hypothetical protein Q9188_004524 [Gyalolechia gomerana]